MLKHNLVLIYRNFLRTKGFFFISILGLSTGLACVILIYLWVQDEINIDKFKAQGDRIFQVMGNTKMTDGIATGTFTPGELAESLSEEIPEIEFAAQTGWMNTVILSFKGTNVKAPGWHVGKDYFNIFPLSLVIGRSEMVLQDKSSIVISRELAKKLFETEENSIGKTIEFQHRKSFQVSGVFEKQSNSSYQFDFVLSFEEFKENNKWVLDWDKNGPATFVLVKKGSNLSVINAKIKDFVKIRSHQSNISLFLQPYSERYLHDKFENGVPTGGRIEYVRLFSLIAILILLIACINFMNLSTARAASKAKEIGIKKSIGAQRSSLVVQFLGESIVTSALSLVIALIVVSFFLPSFNQVTGKYLELRFDDPDMLLALLSITLFTGLIAGSYPAVVLSRFKPAAVLKGIVHGSWGEIWVRKGLVVFQFLFCVISVSVVLVIYNQIDFLQKKYLGYKKDNLILFPIEGRVGKSVDTFLHEVNEIPGVSSASTMGHNMSGRYHSTLELEWEGKNPDNNILFEIIQTNYDLIETLGIELAEGHSFSRNVGIDTAKIIFNEAAIRAMNLNDPIGKKVKLWNKYDLEIVGVAKDFHFESLHETVNPLFFVLTPKDTWISIIRLEEGKEKETLQALTHFYNTYNPGFPFEYSFLDATVASRYASEQRIASLSRYFAAVAILISGIGLFGLAAFTVERKQKEIGIRKVLGSSSSSITLLLSGNFTQMVLLSILVGSPLSYLLLSRWLESFAFHIQLDVWYFISAGILTLVLAWVSIAPQVVQAANSNPVKCLKAD